MKPKHKPILIHLLSKTAEIFANHHGHNPTQSQKIARKVTRKLKEIPELQTKTRP